MRSEIVTEADLIYEAEIRFTDCVEYGVSMDSLSSGNITPPLEGARFDQSFIGSLHGPKLIGIITGIDHLYVSVDHRFKLHIHGQINTHDGHNISFSSEGVTFQNEGSEETQLRATVTLFSSVPEYKWLNDLQIWAIGTLDPIKGEAFVSTYTV